MIQDVGLEWQEKVLELLPVWARETLGVPNYGLGFSNFRR